jgi:hypothetical protein
MAVVIEKITWHVPIMGTSSLALSLACFALALMLFFTGGGLLALDNAIGGGRASR